MTTSRSGTLQQQIHQATNLLAQGNHTAAASLCHSALQAHPDSPLLHIRLGQALHGLGKMENAAQCFQRARQLDPGSVQASLLLGALLLQTGCRDQAVTVYEDLLHRRPRSVQAHTGLGRTFLQLGRPDAAFNCAKRALAIAPGNIEAAALAAEIDEKQGRLEQALKRLQPMIDSGVTQSNVVLAYGSVCRSLKIPGVAIAALEKTLENNSSVSTAPHAGIHFALGELLDATGNYDRAFDHYEKGNSINKRSFDRSQPARDVNAMVELYTPAHTREMPHASNLSELPVFIIGMHRSGSSLVEQILACHPDVHGAGELPDIMQLVLSLHSMLDTECRYFDCLPLLKVNHLNLLSEKQLSRLTTLGGSAKHVTDKMPGNFMYLGFIQQMFPGARIIHCVRNPLDTCLSTYFQNFGGAQSYMNDLGDLGYVYRCYQRMMAHWQAVLQLPMLEVKYEELVTRPEQVIRELVTFCGLPWDEKCLTFNASERFVNTVSYDQVRQPMYTRSINRWKHYDKHLEPLREALGDLV